METEIENWKRTRAALAAAQDKHLQSEIALFEAVKGELPDKGTYRAKDIKITTGYSEKWDQERIADLGRRWHSMSNVPFPFKVEYKPDGKQVGYIRDNIPAIYRELSDCVTLTPKKPAFTLIEKE